MGKVFSPEEVGAGLVPEVGAQQQAARFLLDSLFAPVTNGTYQGREGVAAGLVYGSTTFGPNRRSDLDVLITYDPNRATEALPIIRQVIAETEGRFHTPVEAKVLYLGSLASHLEDNNDPLYMSHLLNVQRCKPQWSRNDPVPLDSEVYPPRTRLVELALQYCSTKVRQFAWGVNEVNPMYDVIMQRALELPGAIGRKVLAATVDIEGDDLSDMTDHVVTDKSRSTTMVATSF